MQFWSFLPKSEKKLDLARRGHFWHTEVAEAEKSPRSGNHIGFPTLCPDMHGQNKQKGIDTND